MMAQQPSSSPSPSQMFQLLLLVATCLAVQSQGVANIFGIQNYGQRTVSERLQSLGRAADANSDTEISLEEMANWAKSLDPNGADCVEEAVWVAGLEGAGFTAEYAQNYTDFLEQQPNGTTPNCNGLDTAAVLAAVQANQPQTVYPRSVTDFLDGFVRRLTEFCESDVNSGAAQSSTDLYSTNSDCTGLPTACAQTPFGCEAVCLEYTFVTTAGRTTGAFQERARLHEAASASGVAPKGFPAKADAMFQDENGDGTFSSDEQRKDYEDNFDHDNDGCVTEAEYMGRMSTAICSGFDFSETFAEAKFDELKTKDPAAPCQGIDVATNQPDITQEDFMENVTALLIQECADDTRAYKDSDECKDLPLTCSVNPLTSSTPSCEAFTAAANSGPGTAHENTGLRFYNNFLSKWGEPYEAFFGDNN